jgi:hypothetical protein
LNAKKEKGRWHIEQAEFERFRKDNAGKIEELQKEYISLYRQGLTVKRLKEKTREDFNTRGIIYGNIDGFAEWTIYNYLMKERGGCLTV